MNMRYAVELKMRYAVEYLSHDSTLFHAICTQSNQDVLYMN
jgi:hypothetical protein